MARWLQQFLDFLKRIFGITPNNPSSQSGAAPQKPGAASPSPLPLPEQQPKPLVGDPPQYRKQNSLMTYQERRFYHYVLLRVVDDQYRIFSKVRLRDLVWMVREPTDPQFYIGETWSKHIDFVICDRHSLEPLVAVELDDSSHDQYDRREADAVKDRVCADAELPLLRVKVEKDYPIAAIGEQIRAFVQEVQGTKSAVSTMDVIPEDDH